MKFIYFGDHSEKITFTIFLFLLFILSSYPGFDTLFSYKKVSERDKYLDAATI